MRRRWMAPVGQPPPYLRKFAVHPFPAYRACIAIQAMMAMIMKANKAPAQPKYSRTLNQVL